MIGERIKAVKQRLERVKRQRGTQRRARQRNETFRVSLVGYTNAGKSTLFNALVKARSYAADQLFATLDTTTRQLWLEEVGRGVSLSDTVGFIRDLPHKLVEAFEATLQEAADADLLLHVVDCASPVLDEQMSEVQRVLAEIDAQAIPQVLVFNKLDKLEPSQRPRQLVDWLELDGGVRTPRVFVSALSGEGLPQLRQLLARAVSGTLSADLNEPQSSSPAPAQSPADDRPDAPARTGTFDSPTAP
jgi:GTP-binding protein HflX